MSDDDMLSLVIAEQRSVRARRRLAGTLVEIQARLNPRALAREAAHELREAGQELAREGLETVKRHPLTMAGVAAAIGLFLTRRPLRRLFAGLGDETPPPSPRLTPKPRTRGKTR
jgi:ElaB/YqjD/DUF883 family membrane-anchored ribosome-binding protein